MGNKSSYEGYSAPSHQRTYQSEEDRHRRAQIAERRLNQKKIVKKPKEQIMKERWDRYQSIDNKNDIQNEFEGVAVNPDTFLDCPICNGPFPTQELLVAHIRKAHPEPSNSSTNESVSNKPTCPLCQRKFQTEFEVMQHFQFDHSSSESNGTSTQRNTGRPSGHNSGRTSDRDRRAAQLEARLAKKGPKHKKKGVMRNEHWQRYKAVGESKTSERAMQERQALERMTSPEVVGAMSSVDQAPSELQLIEQTFNTNPPEVKLASCKLLKTILSKLINATPEARPKFSKIKLNNKKIQQKIVNVPGALDILKYVGFQNVVEDLDEFLIYNETSMDILRIALDRLTVEVASAA